MHFLDLLLFLQAGTLHHRLFQKPIAQFLYIPFFSEHPKTAKLAFIKGELIRYAIVSSAPSFFHEEANLFFKRLRARGYPLNFLVRAFSGISYSLREKTLTSTGKDPTTNVAIFATPFTQLLPKLPLAHIINKRWPALTNHSLLSTIFPKKPMLVYKKTANVYDLVRACQKRRFVR